MRNVLLALATLLALTGALYWHGLSGDLVLDDAATLEPIARLAEGELTWHEALVQHDNFRPLSMASYVANWFVTGDGVWPLKLTNLVVHLICGVLVFLLSDRLLARPLAGVGQRRRWLALWIAACWLLAPLLVSTVLYVTQRMAALATLFSLAALLAYVCGRARIADGRAGGPGLIGIGLVVLWPLAVLSKENGILVPVLALVVELFFFGGAQSRQDNRRALRVTAWCVAAAVLIGIVIATTTRSAVFLAYEYRSFTLVERVLTEWRILFDYLANLLLLPGGSPFGIYHDEYPPSRGLLEPATTLLAGLAWLAILASGWLARGTRIGLLLFGLWFYLAAHLVESTVFPLVLLPVGFATVTYQRVLVWQSWERMLLAALSHYPDSPRVHTGLANLRVNQGKLDEAIVHLERAAEHPRSAELGIAVHVVSAHCVAGRPPPPSAYERLARSPPVDDFHSVNSLAWLATSVAEGECPAVDRGRLADALHAALRGADQRGAHGQLWLLHTHAATLLVAAGHDRDALRHLDLASSLEPGRLEPGLMALRLRLDLEELEDARATLRALEQRDTGRIARHSLLIEAYSKRLEGLEARNRRGG
jgi:hypothetical protein